MVHTVIGDERGAAASAAMSNHPLVLMETEDGVRHYRRQRTRSTFDEWFVAPDGRCIKHERRSGGGAIVHLSTGDCEEIVREHQAQEGSQR